MKAKELRIGNYYYLVDEEAESRYVKNVTYYSFENIESDYNQPIPVTHEWLTMLGFTQAVNFQEGVLSLNGIRMMMHNGEWTFNDMTRSKVIKYVHQLQNLYFALTDEELTLKINEKTTHHPSQS